MERDGAEANFRFAFDHAEHAPRAGRLALRGFLADPDDPLADDVELAAAELITNVIRHTGAGGLLQAWDPKPDVPLRLEVSDSAHTAPQMVEEPGASGGFGLRILDSIADAWGVLPTSTGKVVWAEFDRSKRTPL
jgi:anti-sigma regulatory factor (Ser/Thr protein kinase)